MKSHAAVAAELLGNRALVEEGWDRARRVALDQASALMGRKMQRPREEVKGRRADLAMLRELRWAPDLDEVLRLADWLAAHGPGARVVRLGRVDGQLVEVQP